MMSAGKRKPWRDVVGVVVPVGCLAVSLGVVLSFAGGADVPRLQVEVAAFVASLSAAVLLAEVL